MKILIIFWILWLKLQNKESYRKLIIWTLIKSCHKISMTANQYKVSDNNSNTDIVFVFYYPDWIIFVKSYNEIKQNIILMAKLVEYVKSDQFL